MGGGTGASAPLAPSVYGNTQPNIQPGMPSTIPNAPTPRGEVVEDESCLPWAISAVRGATVSVIRLQVPQDARSQYDKACGDLKKKKFADAEGHVRNAIEKYSKYVAAWVMLGQVLEAQEKTDAARDACSQASSDDPTYLPPYLCLAEISLRTQRWDEILNITKMALGLNPVGDAYAYFYRATAYFHMNNLSEAERSAIQAVGIDTEHRDALLYLLLAHIDEAKGDTAGAAAQVRQFLKFNTDKQQSTEAKQYLAKLESHTEGN